MRTVWALAAACLFGIGSAQVATADWDAWGSDYGVRSRTSYSLVVHPSGRGYSAYQRSYHHGYHRPPYHHPPAVVFPYPVPPPVILDCPRPPHYYHHYHSGHGSIGIYGPRFGFSLGW